MEDNKILEFPDNGVEELKVETIEEEETTEIVDIEPEQKDAISDPDNPLNKESMNNIRSMLKSAEEMVTVLRSIVDGDRNEFGITDDQMKKLYQWNEQHKTKKPDALTPEEDESWDNYNGLDSITEEEVLKIFGEDHKIIGIEHTQTKDRIKDIFSNFAMWLTSMREYNQINDAYLVLIDLEEEKNIIELKEIADKEEDPVKKEKMLNSIRDYYNNKTLGFLKDELDERTFKQILSAFSDERKVEYWLKRTRDKLKQLRISSKFILEISQFEKRFMEEKYHKCSNILLLYFMHKTIYNNMYDKSSIGRTQVTAMVIVLDNLIRNRLSNENKNIVFDNIKTLLDRFIDELPDKKEE